MEYRAQHCRIGVTFQPAHLRCPLAEVQGAGWQERLLPGEMFIKVGTEADQRVGVITRPIIGQEMVKGNVDDNAGIAPPWSLKERIKATDRRQLSGACIDRPVQ